MKYPDDPTAPAWYVTAFERLPDELAAELVLTPHGLVWAFGIDWVLAQDVADNASLEQLSGFWVPRDRIESFYRRALERRRNEVLPLRGDDV